MLRPETPAIRDAELMARHSKRESGTGNAIGTRKHVVQALVDDGALGLRAGDYHCATRDRIAGQTARDPLPPGQRFLLMSIYFGRHV